jgi:hypothetical protein
MKILYFENNRRDKFEHFICIFYLFLYISRKLQSK